MGYTSPLAAVHRPHTVEQGDTLWAISARYGVGMTELLARNPQIRNPNLILPGEKVTVR